MNPSAFVELACMVLDGRPRYSDYMIEIRSDYNGLDMQITRKPMPELGSHLVGTNPTTMVRNHRIIRHHGEHKYLVNHMFILAQDLQLI